MAKKTPIEFWFDFSSPYAYLAAMQIADMAEEHDRTVVWRPFLLGVVFKENGSAPLTKQPMKAAYMNHDVERFARLYDIDFKWPDTFPLPTQAAARAYYWLEQQNPALAADFVAVVFDALFARNRDISDPATVLNIAEKMGADRAALAAALDDDAVKDKLKAVCAEAVERGIFGAPMTIVDGEMFWGADRLWMVEEWLESGGW